MKQDVLPETILQQLPTRVETHTWLVSIHSPRKQPATPSLQNLPQGEILWQQTLETMGRIMDLGLLQDGNINIAGYYENEIRIGKHSLISLLGNAAFLATLNPAGTCIQIQGSEGKGIITNCKADEKGNIIICGEIEGSFEIGGAKLEASQSQASGFIARLNPSGNAHWIRALLGRVGEILPGLGQLTYSQGIFSDTLTYGDKQVWTTGNDDYDAFLLRLDEAGNCKWLNQYGKKVTYNYGYRTREGGLGMTLKSKGEIISATLLKYENAPPDKGS